MNRSGGPSVEDLQAELQRAGENGAKVAEFLERRDPEETLLVALLRLPVPLRFLEHLATHSPWSNRPRLLGAVALNPRTPRVLAQRLLPSLFWRDLAELAARPQVAMAIRSRAEAMLKDGLPEMRVGDRIALAKIATQALLMALLLDPDPKVTSACLINPRLREEDLLLALRQENVPPALLDAAARSSAWGDRYRVRLALVLQARTPLAVALAQVTSLLKKDLLRVAATPGVHTLLQAAAMRAARDAEVSGQDPPKGRSHIRS